MRTQIDTHSWNQPQLTSISEITVRINGIRKAASSPNSHLWPIYCYQIDAPFRAKICVDIYIVTWCGSSLYIICITYYIKWRQNVKVPDIHSVRLTSVLSPKKVISNKLIETSLKAKPYTTFNGIESPKFKMVEQCMLSSSIYADFHFIFYVWFSILENKDIDLRYRCLWRRNRTRIWRQLEAGRRSESYTHIQCIALRNTISVYMLCK